MSNKDSLPRPEYPRPQLVRKHWLNLNGKWEFEFDPDLSGEERELHLGKPFSRTIIVPFCPESELSGIGEKDFMPCVWYRRTFVLPDEWKGKRILLHFGAVDYEATVWINGQPAGTHRGGYASFSLEITHLLNEGKNTIVVKALDDTRSDLQPGGKQSTHFESHDCYYTRTTGIWQTVWLEPVPQTYLGSFRLYSDINRKRVTIRAFINGETDGITFTAKALALGKETGCATVSAHNQSVLSIDLATGRWWEPGNPFLYDLEFLLERDRTEVDRVQSYFGLREIAIAGKKILINGKSIFQRLVLDQGYYPDGIYTAPDDEALRKDIEISMAMGFNGARLHQKVFEPRFLYWADRLGYIVWGEFADWGLSRNHPESLGKILPEWMEVLERDFNHPSIIGWCAFNETPPTQNPELLRTVYRATKAIDPTRPVIDTSGYTHVETDIYDCHNYEQAPEKFKALFEGFKTTDKVWTKNPGKSAPYRGQPYFVSEYGGIWWNPAQRDDRAWGYGTRPKSEKEFLDRYRSLTETLLFHPKMFGFCYTQLYDIEQEVNGLYTYQRQAKFDPEIIKRINMQPAAIEKDALCFVG